MAEKFYCKKTSFLTEEIANEHIERIKKKNAIKVKSGNNNKVPTYAYQCRQCNTWHLTSEEKKSVEYIKSFTPTKMDRDEKKLEEECCRIARQKGLAAVKLDQTQGIKEYRTDCSSKQAGG